MRPVEFPLRYSSLAYVETGPRVSASAGIPPSDKYLVSESTPAPTRVTASATFGAESATESVQTALSATAATLAEPVTVMPFALRAANPEPTFVSPPPHAIARMTAETIIVTALRRSMVMIGLSGSWLMVAF